MCTLDSVVVYSFIFSVFLHHCCWKEIYCKQFKNINSGYWYVAINCSLEWKSKKKKTHHEIVTMIFSVFYLCECILAIQLWLKAHTGKFSYFICISKTECVGLYRRQTSYSTGEAESAIYVYMFVMGHLLTKKLTRYNLFRLLVHSSPKTIYICV